MQPLASSRAVRESFRQILARSELRGAALMTCLEDAGARQGVEPFGACLGLFSRTSRGAPDARITVEEIEAHRTDLQLRLQRDPGFAVAAADYLQLVEGLGWHHGERPPASGSAGRTGERSFDQLLASEWRRHERHGRALSLILLSPWAPAGADVIACAAAAVADAVRDVDHPARVLPDGIALLLPGTRGEEGVAAARRLVSLAGRAGGASWCAGVAALPGSATDPAAFAARVREALAVSLREGSGRVHLSRRERRRHARRAAEGALLSRVRKGDGVFEVDVVDLSLQGARVRARAPMRPGDAIVFQVTEKTPRGRSAEVAARVLRSEPAVAPARRGCVAALAFEATDGVLPCITHILAGLASDSASELRR